MAVSTDYLQAVKAKNKLKIRLMMKNSLVLDPTFNSFWEMERIAREQGIDVWEQQSEFGFERKPKPWNRADMDYEITAIVDDFTKEHMKYLMEIIKEVIGKGTASKINSNNEKANKVPTVQLCAQIIVQFTDLFNTIKNSRKNKELAITVDNINWTKSLIHIIKNQAQKIVNCCEEIERR